MVTSPANQSTFIVSKITSGSKANSSQKLLTRGLLSRGHFSRSATRMVKGVYTRFYLLGSYFLNELFLVITNVMTGRTRAVVQPLAPFFFALESAVFFIMDTLGSPVIIYDDDHQTLS